MPIINADIFQTVCELCSEYFAVCANWKFQFVHGAVNKIHSQTVTININLRESRCHNTDIV